MSKIDNFFKKLENKECQMKQSNTLIINIVNQIQDCEDCKDCSNKRDKSTISESSTPYYTSCDNSYSSDIKCLYKY